MPVLAPLAPSWGFELEEKRFSYRRGTASDDLGFRIQLVFSSGGPEPLRMNIHLPLGPGGGRFAGKTFGVGINVEGSPALADGFDAHEVELRLEPFALEPGAKIKGHLKLRTALVEAEGDFDVEYDGADQTSPLQDPSPGLVEDLASPLVLSLEGKARVAKTVIANVVRDPSGTDVLKSLTLFPNARATCGTKPAGRTVEVELSAPTGDEARTGPQPTGSVDVLTHRPAETRIRTTMYPDGWYRLEPSDDPKRVKGQLVIARSTFYVGGAELYADAVRVEGTFDAVVCHRGEQTAWLRRREAYVPET